MKYQKFGYSVVIEQDDLPVNPREWDNMGTMVCSHRRYILGDEQIKAHHNEWLDYNDMVEAYRTSPDDVVLPLFLYDHSGISMSTIEKYPFNDKWDAGAVGFIIATRAKIEKEFDTVDEETKAKTAELLRNEVRTYSDYLEGNVLLYRVTNPQGEIIESCGGYYSQDDALDDAKAVIDYAIRQEEEVIKFERNSFAL